MVQLLQPFPLVSGLQVEFFYSHFFRHQFLSRLTVFNYPSRPIRPATQQGLLVVGVLVRGDFSVGFDLHLDAFDAVEFVAFFHVGGEVVEIYGF